MGCVSCTGKYDNISFIIKTPFQFFFIRKLIEYLIHWYIAYLLYMRENG